MKIRAGILFLILTLTASLALSSCVGTVENTESTTTDGTLSATHVTSAEANVSTASTDTPAASTPTDTPDTPTPTNTPVTSTPTNTPVTPTPTDTPDTPTPTDTPDTPTPTNTPVTPTPTETPVLSDTVTEGSFLSSYGGKDYTLSVKADSGAFRFAQNDGVLTLITSDGEAVLTFEGGYAGGVRIVASEEDNVEVDLKNCTLIAVSSCPALYFESAKNADISAKKSSNNYIYDYREALEELSSAIYASCDLKLKGSGVLTVESNNNNGIHTKDDLEVKNLTLSVNCIDNALKGNDSISIESGILTLIARQGDGVKTSNSALSSSGNQKGTVRISGGVIKIYAACDGIDASYDVVIENDPQIEIYTDKYSEYSETVTKVSANFYIRATVTTYKYSVLFTLSDGSTVWANSSSYETVQGGRSRYYYYEIDKPSNAVSLNLFVYTSSQTQGQSENYYASTGDTTVNTNFDSIAFSTSGGRASFSWTNKTASGGGGFPGGGGNRDKGEYSTKGIKAANAIIISGGEISITAYDDAIHANNESALESGAKAAGSVTISGGSLTVSSGDDGIHADGVLTISGGKTTVSKSYEGLEGNVINISGGETYVTASDDGVNAAGGNSSPAIVVSGGYLDVTVPSSGDTDGIDSNGSYTQTGGIVITRGPNQSMAAALDADGSVRVSGGTIVLLGYGRVTTSESVKQISSLSLHSSGSHTVKIDGVSYTFNNAYSYGRTLVYSDTTVTA